MAKLKDYVGHVSPHGNEVLEDLGRNEKNNRIFRMKCHVCGNEDWIVEQSHINNAKSCCQVKKYGYYGLIKNKFTINPITTYSSTLYDGHGKLLCVVDNKQLDLIKDLDNCYPTGDGYVWGYRHGKQELLHRILSGDIPEGMVVDHCDGNTMNNRINNLRICTQKENVLNDEHWRGCVRGQDWLDKGQSTGFYDSIEEILKTEDVDFHLHSVNNNKGAFETVRSDKNYVEQWDTLKIVKQFPKKKKKFPYRWEDVTPEIWAMV